MEIRSANKSDISHIRTLWKSCFHDDDSYLDLFFAKRFSPKNTRLLVNGRELVGMIHLIPCKIGLKKSFYWYAVGIAEKYRNKGYFTKFSKEVIIENQKKGYLNLCQPVPGLEKAYEKIGFSYSFCAEDVLYCGNTNSDGKPIIEKASADDFLAHQKNKEGSVVWKKSDILYAIDENDFCDGKAFKFYFQGSEYVSLAIRKDGYFLLDSTNITPNVADQIQNAILDFLECDKFALRTASSSSGNNQITVCLSDYPAVGEGSQFWFSLA